MRLVRYIVIITSVIMFAGSGAVADESEVIAGLTRKIAKTQSEKEKSKLYMYRARNYNNIGEYEKARDDYDDALAYDHKGWIHLERGRFFLAQKNYEQTIKEAVAAEKETATLKKESQILITRAKKSIKKKQQITHAPQIFLTTTWDTKPTRRTQRKRNVRKAYAAKNKASASRSRSVSRS